nr:hypothetical protein Iba_chr12dCG10810 [Ipomoea batatas]
MTSSQMPSPVIRSPFATATCSSRNRVQGNLKVLHNWLDCGEGLRRGASSSITNKNRWRQLCAGDQGSSQWKQSPLERRCWYSLRDKRLSAGRALGGRIADRAPSEKRDCCEADAAGLRVTNEGLLAELSAALIGGPVRATDCDLGWGWGGPPAKEKNEGVQINLLVLSNRGGAAESLLKLVGVLVHRPAILTDVERAEGVSPETRAEAKVASLLELLPRDGRILQLQAKMPRLRHTGKMKRSQAHELPNRGVLRFEELLATVTSIKIEKL